MPHPTIVHVNNAVAATTRRVRACVGSRLATGARTPATGGRRDATTRGARLAERGQAMVEFALVVPILITIVFAAIEFGDAYWKYQQLSAATSEGARKAIISRTEPDPVTVVTEATRNAAPNLDPDKMEVSIDTTWTPGETVTVTSTYPEEITILGITLFDDKLRSVRTMRVEQ